MASCIVDDLDADKFDFLEKDALRQISHRAQKHASDDDDTDRQAPPPNCAPKRKRAALTKKSSLDFSQKAPWGSLIKFSLQAPDCASTRIGDALTKKPALVFTQPRLMLPRGRLFKFGLPVYIPFEFAAGYALFHAQDYHEVGTNFESTEEYIKHSNEAFTLIAFHPFESASDALFQLNAVSKSIASKQLISLLVHNLPKPILEDQKYYIAADDPSFAVSISFATKISIEAGQKTVDITRGLRTNICKFIIGLEPADLEKAQRDLALRFSRQRLKSTYKGSYSRQRLKSTIKGNSMAATSLSSSFNDDVVVVPHRIEGVFIAMGKNEDAICTKNLVPGEAVYGEELISVKDEDGRGIEYRVWNPLRSKLAAAILSGLNNIWVKPGSRVLCMGDVCGTTVSHLSDLVGPDGLVYAVGLSVVALNMAEKRSNIIPIFEDIGELLQYRMLLGMVDVICADANCPEKMHPGFVHWICVTCTHFLKAGGHYLIPAQANGVVSTSQGEPSFACLYGIEKQFKILELITLKQIEEKDHVMVVGGFRILESIPISILLEEGRSLSSTPSHSMNPFL